LLSEVADLQEIFQGMFDLNSIKLALKDNTFDNAFERLIEFSKVMETLQKENEQAIQQQAEVEDVSSEEEEAKVQEQIKIVDDLTDEVFETLFFIFKSEKIQ